MMALRQGAGGDGPGLQQDRMRQMLLALGQTVLLLVQSVPLLLAQTVPLLLAQNVLLVLVQTVLLVLGQTVPPVLAQTVPLGLAPPVLALLQQMFGLPLAFVEDAPGPHGFLLQGIH